MSLSFRTDAARQSGRSLSAGPPRPWPVDPDLSRRVVETRAGIERTRRELARHVSPGRKRRQKKAQARPGTTVRARSGD
jgi:hypothetical protein